MVSVMPMVTLAVVSYLGVALRWFAERGWSRLAMASALALSLFYFLPQVPALRVAVTLGHTDYYADGDRKLYDLDGLINYIDSHSQPDEKIWVYYNASEIYGLSNRPPATRDPEAAYLTQYWEEPWFARAKNDLIADQPRLVIGIKEPLWPTPDAQPLDKIPLVSDWIKANYTCDAAAIRGAVVCNLTQH
jgi:hypothetical protein